MTRENAIISLESIRRFKEMCGGKDADGIEALDLALTALRGPTREMVERMRGEWQSIHGPSEYYCSRCGEEFEIHSYDKDKYQFCPYCMAPMTDEAVDMMLERWKEAVDGVGD